MNIRQHKYKLNRLKGMTQYNAARLAGYSHATALQACKIENIVKSSMDEVFERRGLTDQVHADFLIDTMFNATDLKGKDAIEHPDWANRLKASEQILKVRGHLKDGSVNVTQNNKALTIIIETSSEDNGNAGNNNGPIQEIQIDAQTVESLQPSH